MEPLGRIYTITTIPDHSARALQRRVPEFPMYELTYLPDFQRASRLQYPRRFVEYSLGRLAQRDDHTHILHNNNVELVVVKWQW